MKYNVYKGALALALLGATLASCSKDEDRAIISPTTASTLSVNSKDVVIDAENLTASALVLDWTKANLGYDKAIVSYDLEITPVATATAAAVAPATVALGTEQTHTFTARKLNELLVENFGAVPGVRSEYKLVLRAFPHVLSSVHPSGTNVINSAPVTIHVTVADVQSRSLDYFFVGSMFDADNYNWKNDYKGYPFFLDTPDGKDYSYTGHFNASSAFKFISETGLGSWDGLYGKGSAAGKLSTDGGAGNIDDITAAGYYTVKFSPADMTYSIEVYDASSAEVYTAIGLIGTAVGGWGDANEVALTKSTYDPHKWTASDVVIAEGELKIRSNASWDSKSWGATYFPVGKSNTGDNLKITAKQAGTYDVIFDDLTGHYHFRQK